MDEQQIKKILFEGIGLGRSVLEVKTERVFDTNINQGKVTEDYVSDVIARLDEETMGMLMFGCDSVNSRALIMHPDTQKYYVEIVNSVKIVENKVTKRVYIAKINDLAKDDIQLDYDNKILVPFNKSDSPKVRLRSQTAKEILIYLAEKGAIFEYMLQAENASK